MSRKLVTVREISEILPIEGADFIELAKIDGWQCVVKKNEFKKYEKCAYFEVDSFLPIREQYEFLRKSSYKKMGDTEGFRLKSIKLKGFLSQGLALPLHSIFNHSSADSFNVGDDITEELGVILYEAPVPACLSGVMAGAFPSFISKTDEERCQNLPNYFKDYAEEFFEVTQKEDGSSLTAYFNDGKFGVCSRNLELKESEGNTFWKVVNELKLQERLQSYGKNIALQGELVGENVNGNHDKYRGHHFKLFNIYNIDLKRYMTPEERMQTLKELNESHVLEIKHVPIIGFIRLGEYILEDILKMAEGKSKLSDNEREGIVFKSKNLINNQVVSFKAISNKYLLASD